MSELIFMSTGCSSAVLFYVTMHQANQFLKWRLIDLNQFQPQAVVIGRVDFTCCTSINSPWEENFNITKLN